MPGATSVDRALWAEGRDTGALRCSGRHRRSRRDRCDQPQARLGVSGWMERDSCGERQPEPSRPSSSQSANPRHITASTKLGAVQPSLG